MKRAAAAAAGVKAVPLQGIVATYLQALIGEVFGTTVERRVLLNLRVTTATLLVTLTQAAVDMALAENMAALRVPWRVVMSSSSCFVAQLVLDRQQLAVRALRVLLAVAEDLERTADSVTKRAMAAEVRWLRGLWRFYVAYSAVTLLGTVYTMVAEGHRSAVSRWLWSVSRGLRWARLVVDAFTMLAFVTAFYRFLHLLLVLHHVCSALFSELGRQFQAAGAGREHLRRCCALHGQLDETWQLVRAMLGQQLLPVFLVAPLLLPLFSSAEVVAFGLKAADPVSLATSPLIAISFVPQCLAGQRLEDASDGLALRAYRGPWLEEDVPQRRSRLLAIMSRQQCVPVPGLEQLSRPTCLRVLRTWFQYVQVLLKLNSNTL